MKKSRYSLKNLQAAEQLAVRVAASGFASETRTVAFDEMDEQELSHRGKWSFLEHTTARSLANPLNALSW